MSKVTIKFWNIGKEIYEDETCSFLVNSSLQVFDEHLDYGIFYIETHEPHFYKDGERIV